MGEKGINLFLEIATANDLLEKIELQFNDFSETDDLRKTYLLWDLILSINHLPDWIFKDKKIKKSVKVDCGKKFNPYKKDTYKIPKEFKKYLNDDVFSFSQFVVREIANSAKHFKVEKSKIKKTLTQQGFWGYPGIDAFPGNQLQNAHFVEIEKYTIEKEGLPKDLILLLKELITDWRFFIDSIDDFN